MAAKFVKKEQLNESVRKLLCLYDTSRKEYKDEMVPILTTNGPIKLTNSSNVVRQHSEIIETHRVIFQPHVFD